MKVVVGRENEITQTFAKVDQTLLAGDRILSTCSEASAHAAFFKTLARGRNSICRFPNRFDPGLHSGGGASRRLGHLASADLDCGKVDPKKCDYGVPTSKRGLSKTRNKSDSP